MRLGWVGLEVFEDFKFAVPLACGGENLGVWGIGLRRERIGSE